MGQTRVWGLQSWDYLGTTLWTVVCLWQSHSALGIVQSCDPNGLDLLLVGESIKVFEGLETL